VALRLLRLAKTSRNKVGNATFKFRIELGVLGTGLVIYARRGMELAVLIGSGHLSYAWRLISERRLALYLFLITAALGAVAANAAIMGMFGTGIDVGTMFWYTIGQTGAYTLAAEFLLRIEWP
jgi:hypothetical protein